MPVTAFTAALVAAFVSTRGTIRRAPDRQDILTAPDAYLDHVARRLDAEPALQSVRWVEALAEGCDLFRRSACLNLDPGRGLLSRRCRALLKADGDAREGGVSGEFVEELEAMVVGLARRLFGAGHAQWRAGGVTSARRAVLSALARPHETVVTLDGIGPDAAGPDHPRTLTIAPRRDLGARPGPPCRGGEPGASAGHRRGRRRRAVRPADGGAAGASPTRAAPGSSTTPTSSAC